MKSFIDSFKAFDAAHPKVVIGIGAFIVGFIIGAIIF